MRLLADDLSLAVLEHCRTGAVRESALRELTGAAHATLTARLQLLSAHGLIQRRPADGGRGRPSALWGVVNDDAVQRFMAVADGFALELLHEMRDDIDKTMRDRARAMLDVVEEPGS